MKSSAPPERYDVAIIVHPAGNDAVLLRVDLHDVLRSAILAPEYPGREIQAAVRRFEKSVGLGGNS